MILVRKEAACPERWPELARGETALSTRGAAAAPLQSTVGRGGVVWEEMWLGWHWRGPGMRHPWCGSHGPVGHWPEAGHDPKPFGCKHTDSFGLSVGLHELHAECSGMPRAGNALGTSSPRCLGGWGRGCRLSWVSWLEEQQHCHLPGMEVQHLPHQWQCWTLSGLLCCLKTGKVWIMKI